MANAIRGLTVEIGGDTTKLGKALEDVNKKSRDLSSELGQINKLLRLDPGNADLLAQKQQVLADAVQNTAKKLDTLKEAERQVQAQFERGEVSEEQVRALQREIVATENKLKSYKNAVQETTTEISQLGDEAKETGDELDSAFDDKLTTGLTAVSAAAAAAIGALVAAAESTREYRTEMVKLDTAFTTAGHTSQAATETYRQLQSVLGETDQAVEAANHLAKLVDNEKDLATWSGDILPGVFATFGASLPIEGLTEAANETAKVGQVTGPLADALNWAGVSEDKFNESLKKCNSEQERQALITETLAGLYGEASATYKEANADVIAANAANEKWTASLAQVGAEVEPLLTKVKEIGAVLLEHLVPVVEKVVDILTNDLPTVGVALAGLSAAFISFKVTALGGLPAVATAAKVALTALFTVLKANPVGLVITAITGLVTAFMYLWNNSEAFRAFWINLWENIKTAVSTAVTAVVEFFTALPERLSTTLTTVITRVQEWGTNMLEQAKTTASEFINNVVAFMQNLPYNVGYLIGLALGKVVQWAADMKAKAKETGKNFINGVIDFIKNLPEKVKTWLTTTLTRVTEWAKNTTAKAKETGKNFVSGVVDFIRNLPSNFSTWLTNTLSRVSDWARNLVTKGKQAAKDLVASVVDGVKGLPDKMLSVGSDLVTGFWNGIKNKWQWLKNQISSFADGILSGLMDSFGVHSPAESRGTLKTTDYVGEMLNEGLAVGLLESLDAPLGAIKKVTAGVLDAAANGVNSAQLDRQIRTQSLTQAVLSGLSFDLSGKLDRILTAIERGQVLMLDSEQLVGATAAKYDAKLGQRRALAARGAI